MYIFCPNKSNAPPIKNHFPKNISVPFLATFRLFVVILAIVEKTHPADGATPPPTNKYDKEK